MAKLKGKRIPLIGRVEISIIEESNPRLLSFEQGEIDYVQVPPDLVWNVLDPPATLKARFARQGIVLGRGVQPLISFAYFNMDDPVVGGYTPAKIALRRAVAMAYDVPEEIRVIRQGQAMPATQPVPPNVSGHNPKLSSRSVFDPAAAHALLDRFGYKDIDGDGFRELPDGSPLVLKLSSAPSAFERQFDELWLRSMKNVGLRIEFNKQKWPDLVKAARLGQLQMFQLGNISTTPEGFGFLGLLYGGNAGFSNPPLQAADTTACTSRRAACPTGASESARCNACPSWSPTTRRGSSRCSGTRTCWCIRGSSATSTTRSRRIPGSTSTSTWSVVARQQRMRPPAVEFARDVLVTIRRCIDATNARTAASNPARVRCRRAAQRGIHLTTTRHLRGTM
jgi:hypothetical protein